MRRAAARRGVSVHDADNDDDDDDEAALFGDDGEQFLALDDLRVAREPAKLSLAVDEQLLLNQFVLSGTSKLAVQAVRQRATAPLAQSVYDAEATSRRAALLLRRAHQQQHTQQHTQQQQQQHMSGRGSEFRVHSCRVHTSGALLLDAGDLARPFGAQAPLGSALMRARHRNVTAADASALAAMTPGLTPRRRAAALQQQQQGGALASATPYRSGGGAPGADAGDFDFGGDGGFDMADDDVPNVQRAMTFGADGEAIEVERRAADDDDDDDDDDDEEEAIDVLEFLDIHSTADNPPDRPFRGGHSAQAVDAMLSKARNREAASQAAQWRWPPLPTDAYAVVQRVCMEEFTPARKSALAEYRRRARAAEAAATPPLARANEASGSSAYDNDGFGDFGGDGGFDDDGDELLVDQPPLDRAAMAAATALEGATSDIAFGGNAGAAAQSSLPELTYEELCRRYVDDYTQRAAAHARQTDLSRRVGAWTDSIEPMLDEQEAHGEFDIHADGRAILHDLAELQPSDSDVSDDSEEGDIEFGAIVANAPRWQVCRRFVAALQLVNFGNLELSRCEFDEELNSGSLSFRVLSLEPSNAIEQALGEKQQPQAAVDDAETSRVVKAQLEAETSPSRDPAFATAHSTPLESQRTKRPLRHANRPTTPASPARKATRTAVAATRQTPVAVAAKENQ